MRAFKKFALGVGLSALTMTGCGKPKTPSANGGTSTSGQGLSIPREISAVPTKASPTGGASSGMLISAFRALSATSDYSTSETTKYVQEQSLSQFDTLETIFKALGQTHYADIANVGAGPYKAMVSWQDHNGGMNTKKLEPWVVDSKLLTQNGATVNQIQVWMQQDTGDGHTMDIRVQFTISQPPTLNPDGSYADYGVWSVSANMDGQGQTFFAADAAKDANGLTVVRIHQSMGPNNSVRAVLHKSASQGYGKVEFTDFSSCHSPDCHPPLGTAEYVYNTDYVALKKGTDPVVFKNRGSAVDLVMRYGVYDSATGDDVIKSRSFGFPVRFTDSSGNLVHGYYGAWQGRHQLWANNQTVPAGITVTRDDRNNNAGETYKVSAAFPGTLVKRTLVAADIQDVKNIPVQTFISVNSQLLWNGSQWIDCKNMSFSQQGPTCAAGSGPFTNFSSLVMSATDMSKWVGINGWDNVQHKPINYIYDPNGPSGAGFYIATMNPNSPRPTSTGTLYTPNTNDQLGVNIGGSIWIMFNGTSWVQKSVLSLDQQTMVPTFDPNGDQAFAPDIGREYYINNSGVNYVVKPTSSSAYDVKIEMQSVANPVNAANFIAPGTTFQQQWTDSGNSTFQFITDASSPKYLKLVYATVGSNDKSSNANVGDVVTNGQWGLVAFVNGVSTGVQFNWDYPPQGQSFGAQQYLLNADGSYKLLDDPIRLAPVVLTTHAGESRTLSLAFDGWMNGLPDFFQQLQKNNFDMTSDIADKVIVIPSGQEVVDANDSSKHYLVKPLEMSEFLAIVSDPGTLSLASADAINLSDVPGYSDNKMGPTPDVQVKYSEGNPVK